MQKLIYVLMLFIITISLFSIMSCEKDEVGSRTREIEMEELKKQLEQLEKDGVDIDTTNLSVFYFLMKEGNGPVPKVGDSCFVKYIGFLPNGNKIEDSNEIHPPEGIWGFIYKPSHKVIGLISGIGQMNQGSIIQMYITSDLAHGSKGTTGIPPFTTLIYRAEMIRLKPAN